MELLIYKSSLMTAMLSDSIHKLAKEFNKE